MLICFFNRKKQGEEFNLWTKNWDTNLKEQTNNQSFLPGQIQIKQEPGVTSVPQSSSVQHQIAQTSHIAQNINKSSDTKNTTSTNATQSETETSVNGSVPKDSVKQSTGASQQPGVSSQDGASMAAPPVGHNHDYSMVPGTSAVPKQVCVRISCNTIMSVFSAYKYNTCRDHQLQINSSRQLCRTIFLSEAYACARL